MSAIPLIDLTDALQPGGPRSAEVAQQLRAAALRAGFFYVLGHGVPQAQVQQQFALAEALMALPAGRKSALSMKRSPILRGFEALGEQTLDLSARPDLKESFYCGMDWPADHPFVRAGYQTYGASQWPEELPEAKALCEAYIDAMNTLSRRLMQLMALSLSLPESTFDADCREPMVTLRMVRYPPHPADADARSFGAGAHTDWGAVTILAQDGHGGLEVKVPDVVGTGSGAADSPEAWRWVDAPPIADSFVVNLGDMVPRWTNGLYRSNPHRVRNRHSGGAARYSIPFFFEPGYPARIAALPGTVPAGSQPLYPPCTAGEHLAQKYRETYQLATPTPATPVTGP